PIRDENGTIFGTSAMHRDLTDQKEALAVAQRMAAIVESSNDAIVSRTLNGVVTSWNPAAARMFGYSSQEMIGRPINLLVPEGRAVRRNALIGTPFSDYFTDPDKAEEIYQRVITDGKAVNYPLTMRHRNGHETLTEVLYNASVYRDTSGNVIGVFAAAREVPKTDQLPTGAG